MKDEPNGLCETCRVTPGDCALKWNAWLDTDPDNKYPAIIQCADYKGDQAEFCPKENCGYRNPACEKDKRNCIYCEICEICY
jgi:hypothetical protein